LAPGIYQVSEDDVSGYNAVISGDCDEGRFVTIDSGNNKTCVITNNEDVSFVFFDDFDDGDVSDWYDSFCARDGTCVKGVATSANGHDPVSNPYWGTIGHRDSSPGSCRITDARQLTQTFFVPETREYTVSGTIVSSFTAKLQIDGANHIILVKSGGGDPLSGSKTITLSAGTHVIHLVTEVGTICHGVFPSYFDNISVR